MSYLAQINSIDWDFSDYNSSFYPVDMNSLHWYPASFVPQIPNFLINIFTNQKDIVFDPFSGSGTTAIEALRLNRRFIASDINPFALDILSAKISLIKLIFCHKINSPADLFLKKGKIANKKPTELHEDIYKWFDNKTIEELLLIKDDIDCEYDDDLKSIKKCALSAILNKCSSQNDHFTYITDRCFPKNRIYKSALNEYKGQIDKFYLSAEQFIHSYVQIYGKDFLHELLYTGTIQQSDARKLDWINDNTIDFIITSPPYLCVTDYINSLRLTNLFFPVDNIHTCIESEIGARRTRKRNPEALISQFHLDLNIVFTHVHRVLKKSCFLCVVLGQGSGRVTANTNTVNNLSKELVENIGFSFVCSKDRRIGYKRIRIGGVKKESILVFKKI